MLFGACALSGCASISEGLARAFLNPKEEPKDTRACHVEGPAFPGIAELMSEHQGPLKVIMVHGIGDHQPAYATRLAEGLAKALELSVRAERFKQFQLSNPDLFPDVDLGTLSAAFYTTKDSSRSMIFYELTWTPVIAKQKALLAFDNSGLYASKRAGVNRALKSYANDYLPDPLIYYGDLHEPIQASFGQTLCWATSRTWEELPDSGTQYCSIADPRIFSQAPHDQYVFVSHSLGSRILIDSLQRIVRVISETMTPPPHAEKALAGLRGKEMTVFMLANQLPLLQLGHPLPKVTGHSADYCSAQGPKRDERLFRHTQIVAFSDPNDVLSYSVPLGYVERYMDSRLCPSLVNVVINIAKVKDIFGLGQVANPLSAHTDYDADPRVLALMVHGIGTPSEAPIIKERCDWIETR